MRLTLGDFAGHSLNKDASVIAVAGLTGVYDVRCPVGASFEGRDGSWWMVFKSLMMVCGCGDRVGSVDGGCGGRTRDGGAWSWEVPRSNRMHASYNWSCYG